MINLRPYQEALIIGLLLLCSCNEKNIPSILLSKPDPAIWYPVANSDETDKIQAYINAGHTLGIEVKIAYAVPCGAGRDHCAHLGLKGIYIKQSDKKKNSEFSFKMWDELAKIEGKY